MFKNNKEYKKTEDMLNGFSQNRMKNTLGYVPFTKKELEKLNELAKNKIPIKIKDGKAIIDSSHPDYGYWMKED